MVSCTVVSNTVQAQERNPHLGFGLDLMVGPPNNDAIGSGLGIGFRARASFPLSYDVSLAVDAGFGGALLEGWEEAALTLNPQASVIVTLPRSPWAPYFLAGIGGFIPLREQVNGGPTVHGGIGWARLLTDASLYLEIDPSLVIGPKRSGFILPLRAGIIF